MNNTKKILLALAVALVAYLGFTAYSLETKVRNLEAEPLVGNLNDSRYFGSSTYVTYSLTSTAQKILSLNSARRQAQCTNNGPAAAYVWDIATSTGLTATSGQVLAVNGVLAYDDLDPNFGETWAVTSGSATTSIVCKDK